MRTLDLNKIVEANKVKYNPMTNGLAELYYNPSNWEFDAGNANIYLPTTKSVNNTKTTRLASQPSSQTLAEKAKAAWAEEENAMQKAKWVKDLPVTDMQTQSRVEPQYPTEAISKQQGWQLDQKATDAQHQAWLNNELGEGQVPTAVYSHPEGLAGWLGGLFGGK